ncbi:MAG: signal peptidase II [Clostridiales bacterium]|nr:signal peptidase II [Clostridiales bacterium]
MFSSKKKTNLILFFLFVFLIFIDQLTKKLATDYLIGNDITIIPNVLQLHYLENRGAAWGIFQNSTWILGIFSLFILGILIFAYIKIPDEKKFLFLRFVFCLLAAGAFGNCIDRFWHHFVVDFIYVSAINFPVFNVADCYVTIASILLVYGLIFRYKDDFEKEEEKEF